jgi:hypothetical protein
MVYAWLRQHEAERVVVALNLAKTPAEVALPPETSGAAERLYGEARWADASAGPRLGLPAESIAVVRLTGR